MSCFVMGVFWDQPASFFHNKRKVILIFCRRRVQLSPAVDRLLRFVDADATLALSGVLCLQLLSLLIQQQEGGVLEILQ